MQTEIEDVKASGVNLVADCKTKALITYLFSIDRTCIKDFPSTFSFYR